MLAGMDTTLRRLAAFTTDPSGGNPAGVLLADDLPDAPAMQRIAAEVGYSETAFLAPAVPGRTDEWIVRYFAPAQEVDFCGHATIASGVVLARQHGAGTYRLRTNVGVVVVDTGADADGPTATLTSVEPSVAAFPDGALAALLDILGWSTDDLDPALPPAVAFGGVHHPVVALADRATLADMAYDFDALRDLMAAHGWTTIQVVCRTGPATFDARNPFPVGGVVEDPATGAAAAAFGGYLRHQGLVDPPAEVTLTQGEDMGRRSTLRVAIPEEGGIRVTGHAADIVPTGADASA